MKNTRTKCISDDEDGSTSSTSSTLRTKTKDEKRPETEN